MFGAVGIQLRQILFPFADRGWNTVLLIYRCAGYAFVLLIAVDTALVDTVLSLSFVIAVDVQLRQICFRVADRG